MCDGVPSASSRTATSSTDRAVQVSSGVGIARVTGICIAANNYTYSRTAQSSSPMPTQMGSDYLAIAVPTEVLTPFATEPKLQTIDNDGNVTDPDIEDVDSDDDPFIDDDDGDWWDDHPVWWKLRWTNYKRSQGMLASQDKRGKPALLLVSTVH